MVKTPKKGKRITVQAEVHNECTPEKMSSPSTPKKVRRSLMTTEPVRPHSIENTLVGDINNMLLQTISLIDNDDTNELVRENFQTVRAKLDTLMLKSLVSDGMNLMTFKVLLDDIPLTTRIRVIINDTWKEHVQNLNLPPECKCLQLMEDGGNLVIQKTLLYTKVSYYKHLM